MRLALFMKCEPWLSWGDFHLSGLAVVMDVSQNNSVNLCGHIF